MAGTAVIFTAVLLFAGEAEERELGDNAFFADDYLTAVSHYRSARKLSEQNKLTEAWAQNTLRLGKALLFSGDIAGAKAAFEEFRRFHFMRSAGTLPADILAAEGKFREAEKRYLEMEENGDDELRIAAKFGRAALLLREKKFDQAAQLFRELSSRNDRYAFPARRELAYTLIQQKKYDEALKILRMIPSARRGGSFAILEQLARISQGDLAGFKKVWRTIMAKQLRRPDGRSCELLIKAAQLAEQRKEPALAVSLLQEADKFASGEMVRRDLLKRVINLQGGFDPAAAAESAAGYAEIFPGSNDRFEVLLNAASMLAGAKKFPESIAVLQKITTAPQATKYQRYQAAVAGADFAERGKDLKQAALFHRAAIANGGSKNVILECRRRFAEFLLRNNDYRSAVTELRAALDSAGKNGSDKLRFLLLEAAVRNNDGATVATCAGQLLKSTDNYYRGRAHYELGQLASQRKDFKTARREYLAAARLKEAGQYAVAGHFCAAMIDFESGDFASAGKEALAVAAAYPDSPQAAQALYLGYRAGRQLNDEALKSQCATLLSTRYSNSEAYAVYALQNAADRAAAHRDIAGAISDLEELERKFTGTPDIVSESMLMRIELLNLSGKNKEALEVANLILKDFSGSSAAYFAAMKAGDILLTSLNFPEALKFFHRAGALCGSGIEQDMAHLNAVKVMLQSSRNNPKLNSDALAACDRLIHETAFPQIRLQARYLKGTALEFAGKPADALLCYEKLLNDALLCRNKAIPFNKNYCLRGAVAALQIVFTSRKNSVYNRGKRIIANCRKLGLDTAGMALDKLNNELEMKFFSQDERR